MFRSIFTVAMVGDLIVPYLLAPFYPGYRHKTMVMSYLGNPKSPVRPAYNAWLVAGGVGFCLGAVSFYRDCLPVSRGLAVTLLALLLAFGVGAMILSGLFSVGESKEMATASAKIHGYGSSLGFVALLFVPLFLAILSGRERDAFATVLCGLCFGLALASFVLFVISDKPFANGTFLRWEGAWQRLTLFFMYLPILYRIAK